MIKKYALFVVFKSLRDTTEEESIRSLARKAKVGVATAKRCLDYLLEKDMVKRKIIGNVHQYKLDNSNVLVRQLRKSMSIAEITESGLVKELVETYPAIISITLYGSVAEGTDSISSDIDVLILTHKPIKIEMLKAEKQLKRELSLIKYTHQEWRKKAISDKVFYDKAIIGGIALFGELPVVI
ncbi:MAG: nucleotidyltransferase domain-containing protein [Nanoarchaeota archaeon]